MVSRKTSASPRQRSRSIKATEFCAFCAKRSRDRRRGLWCPRRRSPRPRRSPGFRAGRLSALAESPLVDSSQRGNEVVDPHGLSEELLGARPKCLKDQITVVRRTDDQDRAVGARRCSAESLNRGPSCGSASMATMPISGSVWATTSAKNSYREHSASSQTISIPNNEFFSDSRCVSLGSTIANRRTLLIGEEHWCVIRCGLPIYRVLGKQHRGCKRSAVAMTEHGGDAAFPLGSLSTLLRRSRRGR